MSKVVSQLSPVLAGLGVYLERYVIFKETVVARENDWIDTLKDVISRVPRFRVILVRILLIHYGAAVVEYRQVALADRKVAGNLANRGCVQVPEERGT